MISLKREATSARREKDRGVVKRNFWFQLIVIVMYATWLIFMRNLFTLPSPPRDDRHKRNVFSDQQ